MWRNYTRMPLLHLVKSPLGKCMDEYLHAADARGCSYLYMSYWQVNRGIQIRICAEYRDMLPRPRLDLSGTPGLRPNGLSPGSWQTSLGLGSMSRYSAQILICFIAYVFQFLFLWVWLGTLQDCHHAQCPVPLSIVIRMRVIIRQSKLPACLVEVQLAHVNTLWHLCHRTGEIER